MKIERSQTTTTQPNPPSTTHARVPSTAVSCKQASNYHDIPQTLHVHNRKHNKQNRAYLPQAAATTWLAWLTGANKHKKSKTSASGKQPEQAASSSSEHTHNPAGPFLVFH